MENRKSMMESRHDAVSVVQVVQPDHPKMGFSGTTVTFIFTNLSFLFWADMIGLLGEGSGLAIGLTQLGMVISYHVAAAKIFSRGEAFDGNVYLIFATFFGGVGSLSNLASAIAPVVGIPYDNTPIGYCWILCGLFLLGILPACVKQPWVVFVLYALAGVAVLLMGLTRIGILGDSVDIFSAWLLFVVGVLGFYMVLSGMFGFVGLNLSLGKPLKN